MQAEKLIGMINGMLSKDEPDMQELKKELEKIVVGVDLPVILPKPNPTCENCKHWLPYGNGVGECHFDAPYVEKTKYTNGFDKTITYKKAWVQTSNNDWCGQFEQREA